MDCIKKEYSLIDVEGLAEILAISTWKEQTKKEPENNLYQIVVNAEGKTEKIVHGYWASSFFVLKDAYLELITSFEKQQDHDSSKEEEGTGQSSTHL